MKILINGIDTFYQQKGQGQDILCLVGWAQHSVMFEPTLESFQNYFRVTVVDYPGFGQTEVMKEAWGVDEYVEWLRSFCDALRIENPIIIAHSFGARLSIKYALLEPVKKMVLTGAAGIRPPRGWQYYLRTYTYKALKQLAHLPLLSAVKKQLTGQFGSEDYRALEGNLRTSFVKIVNEDLRPYLKSIETPTLLIWGEKDELTPLWMGKVMEKEMKDAGLVVFEHDDHYAYWHQIDRFHRIISAFIEEDKQHA